MLLSEQNVKQVEADKKIEAQPMSVEPMQQDGPSEMLPPPGEEMEAPEEETMEEDKDSKLLEVLNELVELLKEKVEKEPEESEKSEEESPIDEYKEEKEDEMDEEVTPDEFGMDIDHALATKEEDKEASKEDPKEEKELKEDKKEEKKEEKASVKAASDKASETLSDEFNKDQSDKNQYKQNVVMPQITKVKEDEIPEMFKLADLVLEFEGTSCNLKNAQDESVDLYTMDIGKETDSEREQFATEFITEAKTKGIQAALNKYQAKKVDSLKEKDPKKVKEMTKLHDDIPADTMFDVKKIAETEYKIKHRRASKLVWTAMNKNLLIEGNPLKCALIDKLSDLGIDDKQALNVIESAFAGAADNYFDLQAAKIDEYLSMNDEAFLQVENMIAGSNIRIPEIDIEAAKIDTNSIKPENKTIKQKAKDMRRQASKGSLPISTQSSYSAEDVFADKLQQAMPKPANFGNALKVKK